ncbi:MAG: tripartite tricarboxylate transporter TctB family protein [Syntrophobacterales bacterium]|nr:tripartite tricarboxylate transporter TctB family protein [Syntrophobacterales bacterium]
MGATFRDRLGSALMLIFIAVLWVQRDYTTPFGGIFPDRIMLLMAAFVILALILSFTRYRVIKDKEETEPEGNRWGNVAVVIAIMLAWVLSLRYLGFALTSAVCFTSIAWYISGERKNWRTIVKAAAVALIITFLIVYIFGRLLQVPIPSGDIFD